MTWRGTTTATDRALACLPYILPIAKSLTYALSLAAIAPVMIPLLIPLAVVGNVYGSIVGQLGMFGDLIIFFALYLFVVRNQKISHFIRFNTMLAMMIGIVISLFELFFYYIGSPITRFLDPNSIALTPLTVLFALFFVGIAACYLFSIFCALQGKYSEIRWLSDAAYAQTQL